MWVAGFDSSLLASGICNVNGLKRQTAEVDGIKIAFMDTGGTGVPVVLVHGNSGSADDFAAQLSRDPLDDLRLIAIDLPGHGESGRVTLDRYNIPTYAQVLTAFAEGIGVANGVIVGWSLGGHIVLEAIGSLPAAKGFLIFGTPPLRYPPNVNEAFLPDPAFAAGMTGDLTTEQARAYATSFLGEPNEKLEREFTRRILATDPNARAGLAASVGRPFIDEVALLAKLKKPVAILQGTQERFANLTYIESLAIPSLWRGKVQILDGGHAIQLENASVFNQLLWQFVHEVVPQ